MHRLLTVIGCIVHVESSFNLCLKAHDKWIDLVLWQLVDGTGFKQITITLFSTMLAGKDPVVTLLLLFGVTIGPVSIKTDLSEVWGIDSLLEGIQEKVDAVRTE